MRWCLLLLLLLWSASGCAVVPHTTVTIATTPCDVEYLVQLEY